MTCVVTVLLLQREALPPPQSPPQNPSPPRLTLKRCLCYIERHVGAASAYLGVLDRVATDALLAEKMEPLVTLPLCVGRVTSESLVCSPFRVGTIASYAERFCVAHATDRMKYVFMFDVGRNTLFTFLCALSLCFLFPSKTGAFMTRWQCVQPHGYTSLLTKTHPRLKLKVKWKEICLRKGSKSANSLIRKSTSFNQAPSLRHRDRASMVFQGHEVHDS